ncbi:hypothetical protein GTW71_36720, partial [Streptomyces sp. SID6041]|nr:hypothetical protein [Streptomyces sp. SID6041]
MPRPQLNLLSTSVTSPEPPTATCHPRNTGVLGLYLAKGDGTFTARRQIRGGRQQFTHLAPFDDLSPDGRVDLYALTATAGRRYDARRHAPAPADRACSGIVFQGG